MNKSCGTCSRGRPDAENGLIHCGAGAEERGGMPIWSARRQSKIGLILLLAGAGGMHCERMDPSDGQTCVLWAERGKIAAVRDAHATAIRDRRNAHRRKNGMPEL